MVRPIRQPALEDPHGEGRGKLYLRGASLGSTWVSCGISILFRAQNCIRDSVRKLHKEAPKMEVGMRL